MKIATAARCFPALLLLAGLAGLCPAAAQAICTMHVAVTVDDLPFVRQDELSIGEITAKTKSLLATLEEYQVPAIGFVNEDKLLVAGEVDARTALLRDWLAAGMTLGNHSFGHVGLEKTPLPEVETAVLQGEVVTRWLMKQYGEAPRYYRYPYDQTGPTMAIRDAFVKFLHAHGYAVAPVTMEDDDFVYDRVYSYDLAHANPAEAERIREAYLVHLPVSLGVFETMSRELFGHQIAQIVVIHADRLNADTLAAQLAVFRKRGYCFVSLDTALKDPAYASPDGYAGPYGMSWLHRWAIGLGKTLTVYGQPDPAAWIMKRYDEIGSGKQPAN